jgi:hypothetical protein
MAGQNINQYVYPNWGLKFSLESSDMSLTSDEVNFNQEVVFSPYLIAQTYGDRLPFYFDINNPITAQNLILNYKNYNKNNIFVSQNFYNPNNEDLTCFSSSTSCDIGLTGVDNGLVDSMTGQTITFTNGLFNDTLKFERLYFDRRLKLFQVTGNTNSPNIRFSGFDKTILYEVVSKSSPYEGKYHELYGGFYQGFYNLFGYDYNIFPERMNKGWSVEILLKPRLINEFFPSSGETTLNEIYPQNKNIFFYLGTRAENKFYHHADGSPSSLTGYTRITSELQNKLETCSCCNTGVTNSRCVYVYPPRSINGVYDPHHNYGCNPCQVCQAPMTGSTCGCGCVIEITDTCGWECFTHQCSSATTATTLSIQTTCETDPIYDSMSNAISFKLCGDVKNPQIGVKILKFTGDCVTTGSCGTTGITYSTGYTISEYCSDNKIYDYCDNLNPLYLEEEHWFQLNVVWERYTWLDDCDLVYRGGLGDITELRYLNSLANDTASLITVPYTQTGATLPEQVELVNLNEKWLLNKHYRKGRLIFYVNGKRFYTIEDVEEVLPRALNTDKEKQVGVPFNISWGGGTQGLREHLTFSSTTMLDGLYIQDPECFPNNDLSGTTFSGLNTNILIEQNFAGTFEGAISQFRMYVTPLSAPEIKHNFNILKDKFRMFNPDCPDCTTEVCKVNDFTYTIVDNTTTIPVTTTTTTSTPFMLGRVHIEDKRDSNYLITNNITKLLKTPTPPKIVSKYWDDNGWWGNQGNTPQCVGYAWAHWIEDGPVGHGGTPPIISPTLIYKEAQKVDEWQGESYNGTSVRGGAKYLKNTNKISSYYWGYNINTLISSVLNLGPVVVGTNWYNGMFYPDKNGLIRISGRIAGGHAYVINGVDTNKKLFRIKNSWGKNWGKAGSAYISFNDMTRLIRENGEICLALENNF